MSGGYQEQSTVEFMAQLLQQRQEQGGQITSHPADDGNTQACDKAVIHQRQTEEGEGNVDDDDNNKYVNGHVRGLRRVDTGDR